jgi:phosphoribosylamine---glycine ligase
MNILLIGSGGREHALAWKIAQSPRCTRLWCAPGNPGIAQYATQESPDLVKDHQQLIKCCRTENIELVVIGPERPLAEGMADALLAAGIRVFGPTRAGARLESSKAFAKELMQSAGVPTGAARSFTDLKSALDYVAAQKIPIVIKADGLAEGKGVTVARTRAEAEAALRACLSESAFGAAGSEVLIEEFLEGEEVSLLAFADGKTIKAMDSAQDHKAVFDGDKGPNTGGMGAYSPAPVLTPELRAHVEREVLVPILAELRARGIDYHGVIYAGLIITASRTGGPLDTPKVIEFNCRFGDPETQVLLPRLENDLVEVMLACTEGRLDEIDLKWSSKASVCVVASSGGYPGNYEKGKVISGIDAPQPNSDAIVFQAGTALNSNGQLVTAGGRVLGLTILDENLKSAIDRAYTIIKKIHFDGMHYRRDIGRKALHRTPTSPTAA